MSSKTVTEKVEKVISYCDVCGEEHDWISTCRICGKDICMNCSTSDSRDFGDYPRIYCQRCWELGEPYRKKQAVIEADAEDKIYELEKAWEKKCKLESEVKNVGR